MPTFRIHNPKNRSDRVLIRLTRSAHSSSAFVPPPANSTSGLPVVQSPVVSVKAKKKVSIQQIQEILKLLQKTKNKDLISLLSASIEGLADEDVDVDDASTEEEEVQVEEVQEDVEEDEDDDDVLVIEL